MKVESRSSDAFDELPVNIGGFVYVPDPLQGYVLGELIDLGAETFTVKLVHESKTMEIPYDNMVPAEEDQTKDADDNCMMFCSFAMFCKSIFRCMIYLNEGTLLNNCKIRYQRKQIYTYVANILISINPYEHIPGLYGQETMQHYQGRSLGVLPPHLYAIADKAYRDMKTEKRSQSIIVSGESGAGKTESQKCILKFLCGCYSASSGGVEKRILETSPILDSFGNARTARNNNSSRFGKFVEVHFDDNVVRCDWGYISHYLLEKTRVCHQQSGERNFHVFYQLFASGLSKQLHLSNPDQYLYLRNGCTQYFATEKSFGYIAEEHKSINSPGMLVDSVVDDYHGFHRLLTALKGNGIGQALCDDLFQALAGILHLGNVDFAENTIDCAGGSRVLPSSSGSLAIAAKFLGLNESQLGQALTSRMMKPGRSFENQLPIMVPLKVHEAISARDAFAKAIYCRLFDHIVTWINKSIPFNGSISYIGVLDIAGFESFAVNSFEQFCINYCNEKLQLFFNDRIMKQEQDLYQKESLGVPRVVYADNQDCINLYEMKKIGLFDCLDEEMRLPFSSVQHFTSTVHENYRKSSRIQIPRKSVERRHRSMRDDEGFVVNHYAGPVCYETALFLDKNIDELHESLEALLGGSSNLFIKSVWIKCHEIPSHLRLMVLVEKLNSTGTHFVHCVKPNPEMVPSRFSGGQVLAQLKCAGMASVLKLMQKGYPSRVVFADLSFCESLFYALGLNKFDQLMKQDPENVKLMVDKAHSWILRFRWRKLQYVVLACVKLDKQIKLRADRKRTEQHHRRWKRIYFACVACLEFQNTISNQSGDSIVGREELEDEPKSKMIKYDLAVWKYEDLKKEIDSSTDTELQHACLAEYYRRCTGYRNWAQRSKRTNGIERK
uniref:Myosin motor domain-containing protein n=1 Tax=Ditylenchus dipsaci TaxID=166011 RepID=A0A915CTW3_9BILA